MFNRFLSTALAAVTFVCLTAPSSAAVILITQAKANAGNVTPGDTPGFPVTLSLPGAYRLDTNLTVPANKTGLSVTSHNVDIDMAGFRLYGANSAGTKVAAFGVNSGFGISRIHDGVIMNFKFDGILLHSNSNSWVVENMQILSNGRRGINAEFSVYSRYLYNSILVNGDDGIACGEYCHVEGSNVSDNGSRGIRIRSGTVLGNTIASNQFQGIIDNVDIADTGFGNNTLISNNSAGGGDQVFDGLALHPNVCMPTPC